MKSAAKPLIICLLTTLSLAQVDVRGYTRKDGTEVAPYTRSKPTKSDTKLYNPSAPEKTGRSVNGHRVLSRYGNCAVIDPGFIVCGDHLLGSNDPIGAAPHEKRKRDPLAKASFKSSHPCPANGHSYGSCPGYVIDHVVPLACGGADAPYNMQWQTVADGKAKDKWERKVYCGK